MELPYYYNFFLDLIFLILIEEGGNKLITLKCLIDHHEHALSAVMNPFKSVQIIHVFLI